MQARMTISSSISLAVRESGEGDELTASVLMSWSMSASSKWRSDLEGIGIGVGSVQIRDDLKDIDR